MGATVNRKGFIVEQTKGITHYYAPGEMEDWIGWQSDAWHSQDAKRAVIQVEGIGTISVRAAAQHVRDFFRGANACCHYAEFKAIDVGQLRAIGAYLDALRKFQIDVETDTEAASNYQFKKGGRHGKNIS